MSRMRMAWMAGPLAIACICALASSVEAQTVRPSLKRVSAGVGVGSLAGVGTDDSAARKLFAGTIRFDIRPRLALEVDVWRWGYEDTVNSGPGRIEIAEGNGTSTYGQYASLTTRTSDSTWAAAANVLLHSRGRVSVFGGGGLGVGASQEEYSVSISECSAPSRPQTCNGYTLNRDGSGFIVQAVGGVDVAVTERVIGFASVRASSGYLYGPAFLGAMAGVRFRIR